MTVTEQKNVLSCGANWAWPVALEDIFKPRSVNLLVAENPSELATIMDHKRIDALIMDIDNHHIDSLTILGQLRIKFPRIGCIVISSNPENRLLQKALNLDVFSVLNKPVDMTILRRQLDRLFTKQYQCDIFK